MLRKVLNFTDQICKDLSGRHNHDSPEATPGRRRSHDSPETSGRCGHGSPKANFWWETQ
jgi:hypothetical protein